MIKKTNFAMKIKLNELSLATFLCFLTQTEKIEFSVSKQIKQIRLFIFSHEAKLLRPTQSMGKVLE